MLSLPNNMTVKKIRVASANWNDDQSSDWNGPVNETPVFNIAEYPTANKKGLKINDDPKPHRVNVTEKYMSEATIHGLKYITEPKRHWIERLFWFVACVFSWVICIYMIRKIFEKWEKSPIIVSFDSHSTPIWEIPFPSLTICNMNKVLKSKVEYIEHELEKNPNDRYYKVERRFVDEVCAGHENYDEFTHEGEEGHHDEGNLDLTGALLHKYMHDLSLPCNEMLFK